MDDNVDGDEGKRGINFSPLEIMFRTNLDRGVSKTERNNRLINGTMSKLAFSSVHLKGPQFLIRPPVMLMGKGSKKGRGVGREGVSGVFRGDN